MIKTYIQGHYLILEDEDGKELYDFPAKLTIAEKAGESVKLYKDTNKVRNKEFDIFALADLVDENEEALEGGAMVWLRNNTQGFNTALGGSEASINESFTITVGEDGDFNTINEALSYISKYKRLYIEEGFSATINLLAGFEMNEQVIVTNGIDLSWIKIISTDESVPIVRASLTKYTDTLEGFEGLESWSASFMAGNSAKLPRIGCVFSMDESGVADYRKGGIYVTRDSTAYVEPNCGIWNTDGNGAMVVYSSRLIAPKSHWVGNGRETANTSRQLSAIRSEWQGILSAQECLIEDQIGYGCLVIGGSVASIRDCIINNCVKYGLLTGSVSLVHARGVTITDNEVGIFASEGSLIRLIQSTISNNSSNGIFVENSAIVNSATGTVINGNGAAGIRVTGGGKFSISNPTIQNNGTYGIYANNGEAVIEGGGTINGNTTRDLQVGGGNEYY